MNQTMKHLMDESDHFQQNCSSLVGSSISPTNFAILNEKFAYANQNSGELTVFEAKTQVEMFDTEFNESCKQSKILTNDPGEETHVTCLSECFEYSNPGYETLMVGKANGNVTFFDSKTMQRKFQFQNNSIGLEVDH